MVQLTFNRQDPIPINPFSDSYVALEQVLKEEALLASQREVVHYHSDKIQQALEEGAAVEETSAEEDRDTLAEMVMALRNMITGGIAQRRSAL